MALAIGGHNARSPHRGELGELARCRATLDCGAGASRGDPLAGRGPPPETARGGGGAAPPPETASGERFLVPRDFLDLAKRAALHPDPDRWRILYAVLFGIAQGERDWRRAAENPDL